MAKLKVTNTPGLDGEYDADFDITALTNRELRTIKRISGVTAGKIGEALRDGDNDLLIAYSVVFLARAGKDAAGVEELLWDAPVGSLEFDTAEDEARMRAEEDADRPPASPAESGIVSELDAIEKPSVPNGSSGSDSLNASASRENVRRLTGSPPSEITALSDQATSAT